MNNAMEDQMMFRSGKGQVTHKFPEKILTLTCGLRTFVGYELAHTSLMIMIIGIVSMTIY